MKDFLYNKSDIIVVLVIILVAGAIIYNRSEALLFPKDQQVTTTEVLQEEPVTLDEQKTPADNESISVEITINSGDDSFDICKRLEELGVVEKASSLYNYLIQNKVDTKLRDGTYTLNKNMEFDDIISVLVY